MTSEFEDQLIAKTAGYIKAKKIEQAVQSANDLVDVDPADAIVWYLSGKTKYLSGQYDEALSALSKSASIKSDVPEVWLAIGYTLIALRRYDESKQYLEYAKDVQPANAQPPAALCVLHVILGQQNEARHYLQQAMALDPGVTLSILSNFNEQFIASSPAVDATAKAAIAKMVGSLRG